MYERQYRMPDGTYTTDVNKFAEAWHDIGDRVAAFFPGYELAAFDPDIRLRKIKHDSGNYYGSINLSLDACFLLLENAVVIPKPMVPLLSAVRSFYA